MTYTTSVYAACGLPGNCPETKILSIAASIGVISLSWTLNRNSYRLSNIRLVLGIRTFQDRKGNAEIKEKLPSIWSSKLAFAFNYNCPMAGPTDLAR